MPLSALVPSRKNGSPEDPQTFRACSICHKRFFRSAKAWYGGSAPYFSSCKVPVPLFFPRVTIYYLQITGKYKPLAAPQEPVDVSVEDDPAPAPAQADGTRDEGGET